MAIDQDTKGDPIVVDDHALDQRVVAVGPGVVLHRGWQCQRGSEAQALGFSIW
jgi:hypothetical protein